MNDQYLVSIIVPVYNVSCFINQCVSSICHQTYKNIEILLIDDGSTDDSGKLCDEWAARDGRCRVIHKSNGGLSDARNVGLDNISGDYVTFVDSDDAVASNYVERLIGVALSSDVTISICDLVHCQQLDDVQYTLSEENIIYSPREAIEELLYQRSFLVAACGKMFHISCFEQIRFPVGMLFEDSAIMYELFEAADKIGYQPSGLYAYVHRCDSITTRLFSRKDLDIWTICCQIEEHYESCGVPDLIDAAKAYKMSAALRLYLNAGNDFDLSEIEAWIKQNALSVFQNKKARRKNRIASMLYLTCPSALRRVYPYVNRWK